MWQNYSTNSQTHLWQQSVYRAMENDFSEMSKHILPDLHIFPNEYAYWGVFTYEWKAQAAVYTNRFI